MKQIEIYIDGASKGNPGPSGIGVVVCQGEETVKNIYDFIGTATNNIAEYSALICGLEECLLMKADVVRINTDSQLLARQINKEYKVKDENIRKFYNQALRLIAGFKEVTVTHIPREQNKGADKLANKAVSEAKKRK